MSIFEAFILGILQGITEFLPISSSGHLIFGESFFGLEVENLKTFDISLHMGTLLAIVIYFWTDFKGLLVNFFRFIFRRKTEKEYEKLILCLIVGTLPAVMIGLKFGTLLDAYFRNKQAVAMWMILVGLVFILGEMVYKRKTQENGLNGRLTGTVEKILVFFRRLKNRLFDGGHPLKRATAFGSDESGEVRGLDLKKALIIGMAQAVALIPGVSRSGSTIVAGLFQGIERKEAARFSFLLGIPAILGAGVLTSIKVAGRITTADEVGVGILALLIGFTSSFIFGLLSIYFLMKFLKSNSLIIFAVYRILLGAAVLIFI